MVVRKRVDSPWVCVGVAARVICCAFCDDGDDNDDDDDDDAMLWVLNFGVYFGGFICAVLTADGTPPGLVSLCETHLCTGYVVGDEIGVGAIKGRCEIIRR